MLNVSLFKLSQHYIQYTVHSEKKSESKFDSTVYEQNYNHLKMADLVFSTILLDMYLKGDFSEPALSPTQKQLIPWSTIITSHDLKISLHFCDTC